MESTGRLGRHQVVAFTATAGTSAAVGGVTRRVRVVLTSAGHIKIGAHPTATTSDPYVPANLPEVFDIAPGEKVSAVQASAGGNLHVTELTC